MFNPATGQERARVAFASAADVDRAVSVAAAAFSDWRVTSLANRTRILFRFRSLLDEATDELAAIIAGEHGKTKPDARGEIQPGLETVDFACGISQLLKLTHPCLGVPWNPALDWATL